MENKQTNTPIEDLRELLLETVNVEEVYIIPDSNVRLVYPCIILTLSNHSPIKANNENYSVRKEYGIQLIEYELDIRNIDKLSKLRYCSLNSTPFVSDGLYHSNLTIFY